MRNLGLEEAQAEIKIVGQISIISDMQMIPSLWQKVERLLLNHANTPGFFAPGGEEFNPGPETRLDRSELLCNKVLLKYKGDRESF